MKKLLLLTIGLVVSTLILALPAVVSAATVTYDADVTITLPNGVSLAILSGSTIGELTVNNDSSISLTYEAGSSLTIRSYDVYILNATPGGTSTCVPAGYNQIVLASTSGSGTLTVQTSTACTTPTGGTSGGGGGSVVTPTNTSISVNSGVANTESRNVTLTLSATNASLMMVSNSADFSGAEWQTYASSLPWTLAAGVGTKTVYVKFRSSAGGQSAAINDVIELVEAAQTVSGDVSSGGGGSASLSDGRAAITIPAGAISGSGSVSIEPKTNYAAVPTGLGVAGGKVYDFVVNVGDDSVSSFSQNLSLVFTYTDSDIAGINESTLAVYYFDESSSQWVRLGGTLDVGTNTITVQTNHLTQFAVFGTLAAGSGELISLACAPGADVNDPCKAVYYVGENGKRYVFPNDKVYLSWYSDFSGVKTVSAQELASYPIGGNATYRPGVKMIKVQSDPKVYAVDKGGALRWVETEAAAQAVYGNSWNTMVDDVSSAFFVNYTVGLSVTSSVDYNKEVIRNASPDINTDKGLE